jgi:hypothetical protein
MTSLAANHRQVSGICLVVERNGETSKSVKSGVIDLGE